MAGGRTTIPTSLPVAGRINSGTGARNAPVTGASTEHGGVDISAKVGTSVVSTIAGKVAFVGEMTGYGNVVDVVSLDGRTRTRVAHLSRPTVRVGDSVEVNQQIALSGATGRVSGPHVHYEVAVDGNLVDPTTQRPIGKKMAVRGGGGNGGTLSADGNTSPNVPSGPELNRDEAARLRTQLDRADDYYPNFLNDFHNVAYHIRFFMIDPNTAGDLNPGGMDPALVGPALDGASKVIIAETGVTAGIAIKELTIKSVLEGDADMTGINFDMSLVEPLGTSFYDVTYNAANVLGIENFIDSPYFIEISFKGYDDQGKALTNVLADYKPKLPSGAEAPNFKNGGRWFYIVALTGVETNLTEAGATHQCKMVTGSLPGAGGRDGRVTPQAMVIKGHTVGEMLDDLKRSLNAAQEMRYSMPLITFDFQFESNAAVKIPGDPRSWSLVNSEKKFIDPVLLTMDDSGTPQIQITATKDIPTLVEQIMAATSEGLSLAKNGVKTTDKAIEGSATTPKQIMFKTSCDVKNGAYEHGWRQYRKLYTYRIIPRFHNSLITGPEHLAETDKTAVQRDMVKELRDCGLFRKRFDYFYTGMNTDILSLDIKFDLKWGAVLQNVMGYGYGRAQHTTQASFNDNLVLENNKALLAVKALVEERTRVESQVGQAINAANGRPATGASGTNPTTPVQGVQPTTANPAGRAEVDRLKARSADLLKQIEAARAVANKTTAQVRAIEQDLPPPKSPNAKSNIYAEDLDGQIEPSMLQSRLVQAPADTKDRTGTGVAGDYHRDRAIFGALMEQLAGDQGTMMTLDMDIRGDPFFLGSGNVQASQDPNADPQVMAVERGEIMFLLKVAYPFNQSEGGGASFRNFDSDDTYRQDAFTGFYKVREVSNKFADGQFTQSLSCFRHTMLDVAQKLGYGSVEGELSSQSIGDIYGNGSPSDGSGQSGPNTPSEPAATSEQQNHTMKVLYDAFIAQGFSPEGARTMVAEIGREGDYNPAALYGVHTDANNRAQNAGMVSWQGSRNPAFMKHMRDAGMIDSSGRIIHSDAALQAQAAFVSAEMRRGYPAVYNAVRDPNLNYSQIERTVSSNYVGWDRTGTGGLGAAKAQEHLNKQNAYYARIRQITGG